MTKGTMALAGSVVAILMSNAPLEAGQIGRRATTGPAGRSVRATGHRLFGRNVAGARRGRGRQAVHRSVRIGRRTGSARLLFRRQRAHRLARTRRSAHGHSRFGVGVFLGSSNAAFLAYNGYGHSPYGFRRFGYRPYGYVSHGYFPHGVPAYGYQSYGYGAGYGLRGHGYTGFLSARHHASYHDLGSVRLQVAPRDGDVFVDGYYAGTVNDFDGAFQRLRLEPGPHHIEIEADGYEPLEFDVNAVPGQTIKYKGHLNPLP